MSKTFKAVLITDVSYRDFSGKLCTQLAGTEVLATQLIGDAWMTIRAGSGITPAPTGYMYASIGNLNFRLQSQQFRAVA